MTGVTPRNDWQNHCSKFRCTITSKINGTPRGVYLPMHNTTKYTSIAFNCMAKNYANNTFSYNKLCRFNPLLHNGYNSLFMAKISILK